MVDGAPFTDSTRSTESIWWFLRGELGVVENGAIWVTEDRRWGIGRCRS